LDLIIGRGGHTQACANLVCCEMGTQRLTAD